MAGDRDKPKLPARKGKRSPIPKRENPFRDQRRMTQPNRKQQGPRRHQSR
jgi:hypothetical protein